MNRLAALILAVTQRLVRTAATRPHVRVTVDRMDRQVHIFTSFEDADRADDQFYAELAPEQRLDLLLELVEQHRSSLGETASRLTRVHRVAELSSS